MKIGLQIPSFTWPEGAEKIGLKLAEIAHNAEDAGFASLWVMDHFFQINGVGPVENEMLESYSTLAYLAGLTKKARLGTMVTGVVYRHPGVLIKAVTTLDVLSGGRAYLGIGAAWNEQEARSLGIPFPPIKERFERLEETLQIALQMWSGNRIHMWEALSITAHAQQSTGSFKTSPADLDWRHGRKENPAVGGKIRRCL